MCVMLTVQPPEASFWGGVPATVTGCVVSWRAGAVVRAMSRLRRRRRDPNKRLPQQLVQIGAHASWQPAAAAAAAVADVQLAMSRRLAKSVSSVTLRTIAFAPFAVVFVTPKHTLHVAGARRSTRTPLPLRSLPLPATFSR